MVADIDASASRILELLLSGFDYDLVLVKDDETAYKTFVEFGPDVVFVDTLLPRKGAFELIKRIRQTEGGDRVSVYVTSAIRGGSLKEESLSVWGAAGYLPKPLELDILRSQLAPSLSTKSADSKDGHGEDEEVPEQGEFARSNFPMIFSSLLRRESPIRLAAGLGKVRKAVHFDNGKITFARSNLLAETLASYLQDKNFIDENQYREGVRVSIDQKKMIGEAFISLGAVTRSDIDAAIRNNIEEKVRNLFTWKSGWYKIMPHADPPAEIPGGPIDGWKLLWEEINSPAGQTHVSEYLTKLATHKIVEGSSPSEILDVTGFPKKDFDKVLGLAKGRPVVEACEDVGMRKMSLLYFLVLSGYLEVNEETSASRSGGSENFEELKRRELSRRLAWMSGRNHFQILGVQMTASDAEVSAAYGKLIGELRAGEDKLSAGGEARRLIGELSEIAGKSLDALSTKTKRDEYIESLKHGGDVPLSAEDRIKKAENSYKEGVTALKCQRWDEAVDRLGWAVDMNPSNAEYLIRHSEALLMREGGDKLTTLNRAESNLRKALEAENENPEIYYLLGRVQNAKGKTPQAVEYLQKALALKPSYQAPALELKRMKDQSKGGFSIFGKRR